MYKGTPITVLADLSAETLPERSGNNIFKVMKGKILQTRILSLRFDGESKVLQTSKKLREFSTTSPALQEMLTGPLKTERIGHN